MANSTTALISFILLYLVCGGTARGRDESNALQEQTVPDAENSEQRDGKIFSLFSIVQFKNEGCRSNLQSYASTISTGYRNGTCFTSLECSNKGGSASGGCAAGFGVCCVFIYEESGSSIAQNCSYIRNPGFPNAYSSATQISYTIQKCSCDVCQVRLDFETFVTNGPSGTTENLPTGATVCQDSLSITGTAISSSGGNAVPAICGLNSGQHIYVDMGNACSNTATLTNSFAASPTDAKSRQWDIKVTQVPCGAPYAAEPGCLQYLTGTTGRFEAFNYPDTTSGHLPNQDYSYCIRQEEGYCCIEYRVCRDQCQNVINSLSVPANACEGFSIGMIIADANKMAYTDTSCANDFIGIRGFSSGCVSGITGGNTKNRVCGFWLTSDNVNDFTIAAAAHPASYSVCDCTTPFRVDWHADGKSDHETANTANRANYQSRGFCLEYTQLPC